jgi:hypothetical protein
MARLLINCVRKLRGKPRRHALYLGGGIHLLLVRQDTWIAGWIRLLVAIAGKLDRDDPGRHTDRGRSTPAETERR